MDGRPIPGFWYDTTKKKYFKVQANHLLPQGATYSKENVKKEQRTAKKRKIADREQTKRLKHTVKRSPILQDTILGGAGIHREHGTLKSSDLEQQRDTALISQFRPAAVSVQLPGSSTCPELHLTSATYLPATQQMVIASSHGHTGVSALHVCNWKWDAPKFEISSGCGFAAFHSRITSVSVTANSDMPRVVACASKSPSADQIFTSTIPPPGSELTDPYQLPGVYFRVTGGANNRLVSSMLLTTGVTAVSTAKFVYVLDDDATMNNSLPHNNDEYRIGIDWLTPSTLAFEANSPDSSDHHIKLWDVRTKKGVVSRFKVRNRITGLLNPSQASQGDHQLLASTNHRINLYDTRMPHAPPKNDAPMLSFPHVHEGPELQFTTDGRNMIAAVDRDNAVQIFSMRSGRKMDSLAAPWSQTHSWERRMMKSLQWYDDPQVGSALQACIGNDIVRWSWGGSRQDGKGRNMLDAVLIAR